MTRTIARGRRALFVVALSAAVLGLRPAPAFPPSGPPALEGGPTDYVTVSDGTSIALNVVVPDKCKPGGSETGGCPAILEMAGYENGSSDKSGRTTMGQLEDWCTDQLDPRPTPDCNGFPLDGDSHSGTSAYRYDADYVLVHASIRGTGCSAGEFDLFSERSAMDGYEIIEDWIVDNSRHLAATPTSRSEFVSNGKVGILGHSYSGMTGFMVAAQEGKAARDNDPNTTNHLEAISVSGLIDDLYRGIVFPGGVSNVLFPPAWTVGIRPAYDVIGGTLQGILRNGSHPDIVAQCVENASTRSRNVVEDPVLNGARDTDSNWWRSRSMVNYAPHIADPIHTAGAFQDEQTGPRFAHLWETIPNDVPKRLLMSNGDHGTQVGPQLMWGDRKAWMDYHMRGIVPNPAEYNFLAKPVRTLVELRGSTPTAIKDSDTFPLEDTAWTPYYLCSNGTLKPDAIGCAGGEKTYLSGSKRQSWSYQFHEETGSSGGPFTTEQAPDELNFISGELSSTQNVLIDGPITADLYLRSTAPDTELFVQVADRNLVTGELAMLQRGMLRASHRAVDPTRSDYDENHVDPLDGSTPFLYRPFRPHTNAQLITPGAVNHYLVEIFPVAHIFRPGHALQIKIMAPPAVDSYYSYAPKALPSLNSVLMGGSTLSRITLPIVPMPTLLINSIPACKDITQYRCIFD